MRALCIGLLIIACAGAAWADAEGEPTPRSGPVVLARIDGSINPASSDYLIRAIRQAEDSQAALLLLEMDTPGGLVASTQDMIQAMLASKVPIVVFVAPQGAWAGSAGTFITLAAHVAVMSPGSSIGAAHPVGIGGGSPAPQEGEDAPAPGEDHSARKAENLLAAFIESIAAKRNRNVEWAEKAVRESVAVTAEEALELGVIDLVADDQTELLALLEGRVVEMDSGPIRLELAGAIVQEVEWGFMNRVLNVIVDPNVAVLLFMAGLLGLYIEMNQPGMIVPGAAGAVCLFLALIAMQVLPFSWVGVALMLAGVGLFVAELFITSYGLLFAGGVVCLLLGGTMLFDQPEIGELNVDFWRVLVPAVGGFALFGGFVVFAVGRTLGRRSVAGADELVGMRAVASTRLDPSGTVFLHGEYWKALAEGLVEEHAAVEVVSVEGLQLRVRPAPDSH